MWAIKLVFLLCQQEARHLDSLASLGNIMVTQGHRPRILSTFLHFIWAPVHLSAYFLCYKN